jgi:TIR domain/Dynamin family
MSTDVFVSYVREDHLRVEPIVSRLAAEGFTVFWDRKLELGGNWLREINAHLDAAPCIIVVWSATSVNSPFVQAEAMKGFRRQVLVPIMIDAEVDPPAPFGILQSSRILSAADADWPGLVGKIQTLVNQARASGVPPSASELTDQVRAARESQQAEIGTIVEPLRRVAASRELQQTEVDQSLAKIQNHILRDDLFAIAVVGRMKVGKSTLLNVLLGLPEGVSESPLPTDDDPCTATLIKLRYSDQPYCRPYEWDHERNAIGRPMPDWTFEEFQKRARLYDNGQATNIFDDIAEFEVGWPSPLLRQGVILLDTPGISEAPERTKLTRAAIADVDAAIVVYRSEPLAGTDEIEFADYVTAHVGKVFTLVNLRGEHKMPPAPKLQNVVRSRLSLAPNPSLEDQDVFLSHLKEALTAKKKRDGRLSESAGMRQFEARIAAFLIADRYSAHILKAVKEIQPLARSLSSTIQTLTAGAHADSGKLKETIAVCKEDLGRIQRKKGAIDTLIVNARNLAESVAQRSFEAKVSAIANDLPSRIGSLDLGIDSFLNKLGAGTVQSKKWTKITADKITSVAQGELESWASAESNKPGLACDLKPTVDQLIVSLTSVAEDIADVVKRMRARIAALDPSISVHSQLMSDAEVVTSAVIGTILFGPLGIVGLGGWRGVVGATGGALVGGIGIGLAVALLHLAFPPTAVITAIGGAFALGGAILGSTQGLEERLKKKAWAAVEPELRRMAENPKAREQLRGSIHSWFAEINGKVVEGLARIVSIEQQTIDRLEKLSQEQGNLAEYAKTLEGYGRVVDAALDRATALDRKIDGKVQRAAQ